MFTSLQKRQAELSTLSTKSTWQPVDKSWISDVGSCLARIFLHCSEIRRITGIRGAQALGCWTIEPMPWMEKFVDKGRQRPNWKPTSGAVC